VKRAVLAGVVAVVSVLAFCTAVLFLAGAPPLEAYRQLAVGAFGSWTKLAQVLAVWVPLTLCACGLLFTFQVGLWNIGVEGQVILGAVGATAALRWASASGLSPLVGLTAALAGGAALGACWAFLAGVLKTRGGVNEIFAGLGLNFVAQGLILWLIFGPWKRPGVASMSGTQPFAQEFWLENVSWGRVSPTALVLALAAVATTLVLLRCTRVGLSLKAIGRNATAAALFGLRPGRNMLLAMALAGGFAGLAGTVQIIGVYHRLIPAISSNYGYLGLLVTMLAGFRVGPVPFIALFFAALNVGSVQLPMVLHLDSSLSGVVQGAMVLAVLCVHAWARSRPGQVRP
jgi:simple sugar transport system permease protein